MRVFVALLVVTLVASGVPLRTAGMAGSGRWPAPAQVLAADRLAAASVVADSVRDFSGVQGQAGWRYGWYVSPFTAGTFTEMTQFLPASNPSFGDTWWEQQGTYWTSLWSTGGHPEGAVTSGGRVPVEQWAVRRWVSTVAGSISLSATLAKAAG